MLSCQMQHKAGWSKQCACPAGPECGVRSAASAPHLYCPINKHKLSHYTQTSLIGG